MTIRLLDAVRRLQEHLREAGLARAVLSLPAPRMLSLPSPTGEEASVVNVFAATISEKEIQDVSRDLFVSGHYSLAVQEAYKAIDKFVADKSGIAASGTTLMDQAFSPKSPKLYWTERKTNSENDEQLGYHRLYSGAMLGVRNPIAHEFNWIDNPDTALELLVFAQHLLRKAKGAQVAVP